MDELMLSVIRIAQRHAPLAGRAALENPDAELQAAGLTSLELVGFILDLEQSFGVSIGDELMQPETFRSSRTVAAMLLGQLQAGEHRSAAPR